MTLDTSSATTASDPSGTTGRAPAPTRIGPMTFAWGTRTFVMGILNVTPDSFSGDGLLADPADGGDPVAIARAMVAAGADLLDIGGESTRPGHATVDEAEERARVVPVIAAIRAALPTTPLSIDTTKPGVAEAALAAGADLLNDVWGTGDDDSMARVAAAHGVPIVLMHNRAEPVYRALVAEVVADLERALERAIALGVDEERAAGRPGLRVRQDPGAQRRDPSPSRRAPGAGPADPAGDLPQVDARPDPRPAGRATARGDARDDRPGDRGRRGHRPRPRCRGERPGGPRQRRGHPRLASRIDRRDDRRSGPSMSDRILLANLRFEARHGVHQWEQEQTQPFEVDVELTMPLQPAGIDDDLTKTIDYSAVYGVVRQIVESTSYRLLEALAEAISHELLADFAVDEVMVRVRKPAVQLGGPLDYAGVEIRRRRAD